MACRVFALIAVGVGVTFMLPSLVAQQSAGLKLGEKFEGELTERKLTGGYNANWFVMELPVDLKAGQSVSVVATVIGSGRQVSLALLDPTGTRIGGHVVGTKTVQLAVDEVSAKGKYTILISSDRLGLFNLRANGLSSQESSIKSLEAQIERLERELSTVRAKLKAAKAKADSSSGRTPSIP